MDSLVRLLVVDHVDRAREARPHEAVVSWPEPVGAQFLAPKARAQEEAGRVVARLAESGWWTVRGVDFARLLRDLLVREISEHLLALAHAEALLDAHQPAEVRVHSPLRPGYYVADEMIVESLRLATSRRGTKLTVLASPWRRAGALAAALTRRAALHLAADRALRECLLVPAVAGQPPSASPVLRVGPCWAAELQAHRPVTEALRARGWSVVPFEIPFYHRRAEWRSDALPEGATPIGAWGRRHAWVEAVRTSEALRDRLADPAALAQHRAALETSGVNLLGSSYLRARLLRLATVEARLAMAVYESARRLCELAAPSVLLCAKGEGPEARAVMTAARDSGVPTVFIPHGVPADDARWDDVPADLVLADSDFLAEVLARRTGGRVHVTTIGAPKYDAFVRDRDQPSVTAARAELPCAPSAAVWIAVAGTDNPERDAATISAVADFARAQPSAAVVVRPHPRRSQPELLERFRRDAGPEGRVFTSGDTMRILWCCDAVVSGPSTVALEALAAGRPVIQVGALEEDVHGCVREGVALHAESPASVPPLLAQLLRGEIALANLAARGRGFAARKLGPLDGRATDRAVAAIEALAGRA